MEPRDVKIKRITQCKRLPWLLASAAGLPRAPFFAPPVLRAPTTPSSRDAIVIEGNRRVDAETVRSYFHAAPDGQFDDASRDVALKALIATGLFRQGFNRSLRRTASSVSPEAPVLDRIAFEGNKKVKDADLAAAIASKPRGTLQRRGAGDIPDVSSKLTAVWGRDEVSVVGRDYTTMATAASISSTQLRRAQRPPCGRFSLATTFSAKGSSAP